MKYWCDAKMLHIAKVFEAAEAGMCITSYTKNSVFKNIFKYISPHITMFTKVYFSFVQNDSRNVYYLKHNTNNSVFKNIHKYSPVLSQIHHIHQQYACWSLQGVHPVHVWYSLVYGYMDMAIWVFGHMDLNYSQRGWVVWQWVCM